MHSRQSLLSVLQHLSVITTPLILSKASQTLAKENLDARLEKHMSKLVADGLADDNSMWSTLSKQLDVVGIGARRVEEDLQNKDKTKDDNTYNIRDDTDTGKAIRDLWYHLKRVLETEQFDSDPE